MGRSRKMVKERRGQRRKDRREGYKQRKRDKCQRRGDGVWWREAMMEGKDRDEDEKSEKEMTFYCFHSLKSQHCHNNTG